MAYLGKTPSQAVRSRYYFTATGGETSLSGTDDNSNTLTFTDGNYVDVTLNGVTLVAGTDYNTTTANTIGGLTALTASDVVEVVVYDTFSVFSGEFSGDISLGDNVKAKFGAGDDLQIYHDGSHSYIDDAGTGNLHLRASNQIQLQNNNGTKNFVVGNNGNGWVRLYYNNVEKLETTSTGVDVIGSVTADGLTVNRSGFSSATISGDSTSETQLRFDTNTAARISNQENTALLFDTNATERMRIDSSGDVGIGTSSPTHRLTVSGVNNGDHLVVTGGNIDRGLLISTFNSGRNDDGVNFDAVGTNGTLTFSTVSTERMRLNSSGTLLVGTTDSTPENNSAGSSSDDGTAITAGGRINVAKYESSSSSGGVMRLNRTGTDGVIAQFRKDGTAVGSIGVSGSNTFIAFRTEAAGDGTGLRGSGSSTGAVIPTNGDGDARDNGVDLGGSGTRFDDVYATNGTIQTSDENEKQQIASLTSAEITAAKAISKLFKTFKWNSSVTENGDNARTHTGVIAQQVETAMTDAGLDAGDYAFFISSDWYVDADGNEVEADAVGAIAKNRKGIRYPELLSFIGAATEQRLADIETRLTALENA